MKKVLSVNPERCTISVNQNDMNPTEVEFLIKTLRSNLYILRQTEADPIQVLNQSVRLNVPAGEISFRLSWNTSTLFVGLDAVSLPEPNVNLMTHQLSEYEQTLWTMIKGATNG